MPLNEIQREDAKLGTLIDAAGDPTNTPLSLADGVQVRVGPLADGAYTIECTDTDIYCQQGAVTVNVAVGAGTKVPQDQETAFNVDPNHDYVAIRTLAASASTGGIRINKRTK